jgi:hypothetical protein
MAVYGIICLLSLVNLMRLGFSYLLFLAIPGVLVFAWHLWLVSRREERYQIGIDVIASGTLALAAPAALWVGLGGPDPIGWWLWALVWLQSAASIVYAFLRLEQRRLKEQPGANTRLIMARRALLYSGFNLSITLILSITGKLPNLIWLPYSLQLAEVFYGTLRPALGVKPTTIGFRQLGVSTLFTVLFILAW